MARINFVKSARKKNPVAEVGESYFWIKFRYGGKRFFKTRPPRSATTQSEFLGQVYDIQDREWDTEDLANDRDTVAEEVRALGEECLEKKENMPEPLQEAETGQLLQERSDQCDEWADSLEGVECDPVERGEDGDELDDINQAIIDELIECDPGVG